MNRVSGVLCPVSALPSRFGCGDFAKESRRFVDLLKEGGFSLWQILPLNPLGYGHSPYQPFSSFALEEIYVDLDELADQKLCTRAPDFQKDAKKVDYETIRGFKAPYLKAAYREEMKRTPGCLDHFVATHPWVIGWSLFMMNKRRNAMASWESWPKEQQEMITSYPALNADEEEAAKYEIWLQKTLYSQWQALKAYANKNGIRLVGDVPFYVGFDSCDVWANQDSFLLDPETRKPLWIAGVPPDYFSKTGQRWGNPIYDWALLEKRHFAFIINRLKLNGELYDVIRLDHFRAFDTYWKIPASCPTAVEGAWIEAPGYKLFDQFFKEVPGLEIIAEDLGDLRPEVLTLRDHYNFPGMNVVEFTFHDAEIVKKPGCDRENMVAYLGTHDNDPLKSYFSLLPLEEQKLWLKALDEKKIAPGDINDRMIAYELSLKAKYAIFAMQDLLGLGAESRLNKPGIIDEFNWTWRMVDYAPFQAKVEHLKHLNAEYHR
jgi:4-alpha-glucanotransferase